jgi:FeS assembly SUF system protein
MAMDDAMRAEDRQPQTGEAPACGPAAPAAAAVSEEQVVEAIRTVYDPEIPVNIYDLGLIYTIDIGPEGKVHIDMTLTAPGCPVAGSMPTYVEDTVALIDGVREVEVELVWDPPWTPDRMSEDAKLALGMI